MNKIHQQLVTTLYDLHTNPETDQWNFTCARCMSYLRLPDCDGCPVYGWCANLDHSEL